MGIKTELKSRKEEQSQIISQENRGVQYKEYIDLPRAKSVMENSHQSNARYREKKKEGKVRNCSIRDKCKSRFI